MDSIWSFDNNSGALRIMEFKEVVSLLNSGGNVALLVCCYFIYKASERLARIEKALQAYMTDESAKP